MKIVFFLFSLFSIAFGSVFVFTPPNEWLPANSSKAVKEAEITFFEKGFKQFPATLTFSKEAINIDLEEYILAVKKGYAEEKMAVLDMGKLSTQSGDSRLLKISSETPFGEVCILQSIFVFDKVAYILTAACLKSDFSTQSKKFLTSFRSLTFPSSLNALVPKEKISLLTERRKALLENLKKQPNNEKKLLEEFSSFLSSTFADLGSYWIYLYVKELYTEFHSFQKS